MLTFISRECSQKKNSSNSRTITSHINCSGGDLKGHNEYFVTPQMLYTPLRSTYTPVKNVNPPPLPSSFQYTHKKNPHLFRILIFPLSNLVCAAEQQFLHTQDRFTNVSHLSATEWCIWPYICIVWVTRSSKFWWLLYVPQGFNIRKIYVLRREHIYMFVAQNKRLHPMHSLKWRTKCVYCPVRTEPWNIIRVNLCF